MDYKIFSSNRSILQSSAIHPIIATADKSGHFVPVGVTSAFVMVCSENSWSESSIVGCWVVKPLRHKLIRGVAWI